VDELTTTTGIVAVAAAAVAVLALLLVFVLWRRLSKLRAAQRVVFGEREARDLVSHAAEHRINGCVTYTSLVRYDAYNEMSGRQSTSIALLDSRGSGIVISSIHHRDQARLYAKQVVDGQAQLELSPEEEEAMRVALAGEVPDAAERRR